jgi:hypothetical protein
VWSNADGLWNFITAADCSSTLEQSHQRKQQRSAAEIVSDSAGASESQVLDSAADEKVGSYDQARGEIIETCVSKKRKFDDFVEEETETVAILSSSSGEKAQRQCLHINSHNPCPSLCLSSSQRYYVKDPASTSPLIWEKAFVPRQEYRKGAFVAFSSRQSNESLASEASTHSNSSHSSNGHGDPSSAANGGGNGNGNSNALHIGNKAIAKVDSLCADRRVGIMRKVSVTVDKSNIRNSRKLKGPAADLLYKCVDKAANENGLNPSDLIDNCDIEFKRTNPTVKSTRRYIDDVTIMVLELQHSVPVSPKSPPPLLPCSPLSSSSSSPL